ncbi:MAG: NADH-quinone oxidoreductase subunit C, partial [Candidatus Aminicenantales bacterium]
IEKFRADRLVTITCLEGKTFLLYYHFDRAGKLISLKVSLPKKRPIISSIENLFPTAGLFEREIHDFFGIEFKGNARLHDKLFLPESWKRKPPLLKHLRAATSAKYQEVK